MCHACDLQCRLNTDTLRILCGKSFDLQHCTVKCLQQKFLLGQNGTVELGSAGQEAAVVQQVYAPSSTCEWVVTPVEVVAVRLCVLVRTSSGSSSAPTLVLPCAHPGAAAR